MVRRYTRLVGSYELARFRPESMTTFTFGTVRLDSATLVDSTMCLAFGPGSFRASFCSSYGIVECRTKIW